MVKSHKLARVIIDASWGVFLRVLEYKAEWYGKQFVKLNRFLPFPSCVPIPIVISKILK